MADTARRRLRERANEHYGYITGRDAAEFGIPDYGLPQLADWGGLTRIAHGVYRFDDIPVTSLDGYMEAVLVVGEGAFLMGDSVLALHNLALVNPPRMRVGTPKRVRKTLPPGIEVVWTTKVPGTDLTLYERIPCTRVARALVDCVGIVMTERLIDAANEAAERGLLRRSETAHVLRQLGGQG